MGAVSIDVMILYWDTFSLYGLMQTWFIIGMEQSKCDSELLEWLETQPEVLGKFEQMRPCTDCEYCFSFDVSKDLLSSTILLKHWSGRNSRGVSQFEGKAIETLIWNPRTEIDLDKAKSFLHDLIAL